MYNLKRTKTKYTYYNLGDWITGFPKSLSATTVCSSLNFWNHNRQLSWTLRSLSITCQLWNYSGKSANRSDSHSRWVLSLGSFWHITAPEQCKLVAKYRTNEPEEQMGSPQTHPPTPPWAWPVKNNCAPRPQHPPLHLPRAAASVLWDDGEPAQSGTGLVSTTCLSLAAHLCPLHIHRVC